MGTAEHPFPAAGAGASAGGLARDHVLAIVQTVREPLIVLDGDCRVGLANDAFYALFGEGARRMEGQVLRGGGTPWIDPILHEAILSACEGRADLRDHEIVVDVPPRGRRTLVLNARRIVPSEGPTMLVVAITDATDIRQAEDLRIDAETLRLMDRRKDEFLGVLAHELRNPLGPMRFAIEILRRAEGKPEETVKARQVLERQMTHLVRIVDDLLDVSRITQGKVELRKETLELEAIVNAAVELSRPSIDAAGHTVSVSLPHEVVRFEADPVRMTQVLVNLLSNAVKFTPPGGHIWLLAEKTGADDDHLDQLRIRIRDTGIGIAADVLPSIFDMFVHGDRDLENTRGGLGVGLTLVRNLLALHWGSIDVNSAGLGSGSEFIVTLPIDPLAQPPAAAPTPRTATPESKRRRILVADDDTDGREMLDHFLRAEGHTVATAHNGHDALRQATEFKPDTAIIDIGMPGLNGYETAARLRWEPATRSIVLIALSGFGREEDKTKAFTAGFDQHFTKPVDINALTTFLANVRRKD